MPPPPPLRIAVLRTLLRIAAIVALAVAIHQATDWLMDQIVTMPIEYRGPATILLVGALLWCYALLLAIPFVPGVEIGLAVLMAYGAAGAPFVYLATCLGLLLAYCVGRFLPVASLIAVFRDLHMRRACELLSRMEPLDGPARLALLRGHLPERLAPAALKWRYLALALLINLPGNAVIGGGGGILLMAGLSRIFLFRSVVLTIVLAVAPVPLAVIIFGAGIID
ncbi:hypothetical protein DDZ14_00390 [Maritimibacter sp. 55A14]|nr:hypothetical protein DDZ14_00390 [Maritimibacter sp. 55A14]